QNLLVRWQKASRSASQPVKPRERAMRGEYRPPVPPVLPSSTLQERARRYSTAQRRTIDTALELFAAEGVGGTSLQMIADALGVTKAAIYHQFHTKESIVVGVLEVNLAPLEDALEAAEVKPRARATREELLRRVIDQAVRQRRAVSTLQNDPVLL